MKTSWLRRLARVITGIGYRPVADDCQAYLAGRYVEHVETGGLPVPVPQWAWLNVPARGLRDEIEPVAAESEQVLHRFFFGWRECRSVISAELLDIAAGDDNLLRRLQEDVVQPAESTLCDGEDHSPLETVRDVLVALRGYVAARDVT